LVNISQDEMTLVAGMILTYRGFHGILCALECLFIGELSNVFRERM
jgi:hypothetical protein